MAHARLKGALASIAALAIMSAGALPTVTPAAAAGTTVPVPTSINAKGGKDVTGSLNAFLASVPDGSTIVFPAGARFKIEGTLLVTGKRDIVIQGNGAEFFAKTNGKIAKPPGCGKNPNLDGSALCDYPNRVRAHWRFTDTTNLVVQNVVVTGSSKKTGPDGVFDPAFEAQHAFDIGKGSDGVVLDGVTAGGVWGDFVSVQRAVNVTVKNSTFDGSSRQGITVANGDRVLIQSNSISNTRRSMFDLEPNTTADTITNVTIRDNDVGVSRFCTLNNNGPAATVHDITFDGNRMHGIKIGVCIKGFAESHRQRFTITNNTSDKPKNEMAMKLEWVDGAVISGNRQAFSPNPWGPQNGDAPVVSKCSTGITVQGNMFEPRPPGMPEYFVRSCS